MMEQHNPVSIGAQQVVNGLLEQIAQQAQELAMLRVQISVLLAQQSAESESEEDVSG